MILAPNIGESGFDIGLCQQPNIMAWSLSIKNMDWGAKASINEQYGFRRLSYYDIAADAAPIWQYDIGPNDASTT